MPKFFCNNNNGGTKQNLSTSFKSLVVILATTSNLRRTYIEELFASAAEAPNSADCPILFDVSLVTADGTGTSSTPQNSQVLETGTILAPATTGKANYTSEPTITANSSRLNPAVNQRSQMKWAALTDDHRILGPAVAANGWSLRALSPNYAATANGEIVFSE